MCTACKLLHGGVSNYTGGSTPDTYLCMQVLFLTLSTNKKYESATRIVGAKIGKLLAVMVDQLLQVHALVLSIQPELLWCMLHWGKRCTTLLDVFHWWNQIRSWWCMTNLYSCQQYQTNCKDSSSSSSSTREFVNVALRKVKRVYHWYLIPLTPCPWGLYSSQQ